MGGVGGGTLPERLAFLNQLVRFQSRLVGFRETLKV